MQDQAGYARYGITVYLHTCVNDFHHRDHRATEKEQGRHDGQDKTRNRCLKSLKDVYSL